MVYLPENLKLSLNRGKGARLSWQTLNGILLAEIILHTANSNFTVGAHSDNSSNPVDFGYVIATKVKNDCSVVGTFRRYH